MVVHVTSEDSYSKDHGSFIEALKVLREALRFFPKSLRLFTEAVRGFEETLRTSFLPLRMPVEVVRLLKEAVGVQIV